jgi:hypothetical protein
MVARPVVLPDMISHGSVDVPLATLAREVILFERRPPDPLLLLGFERGRAAVEARETEVDDIRLETAGGVERSGKR